MIRPQLPPPLPLPAPPLAPPLPPLLPPLPPLPCEPPAPPPCGQSAPPTCGLQAPTRNQRTQPSLPTQLLESVIDVAEKNDYPIVVEVFTRFPLIGKLFLLPLIIFFYITYYVLYFLKLPFKIFSLLKNSLD